MLLEAVIKSEEVSKSSERVRSEVHEYGDAKNHPIRSLPHFVLRQRVYKPSYLTHTHNHNMSFAVKFSE